MKREFQILIIFLGTIAVSGIVIYMVGGSNAGSPVAIQSDAAAIGTEMAQMPPGPDPEALKQKITALESQLKSDPNNYDAIVGLGNAYYDTNEPQKAIEYYEKALRIKPDDVGVIVDMGAMYRQIGNAEKAIELFNNAILIDPRLPQSYFNLGMVLRMEKNDAAGAAKAWQKYLELDPNSQAREFLQDEIKKALAEK